MKPFVSIDFETADQGPDSACAVGLVKAAEGRIIARSHFLIRPPRREFFFTYIHGINWAQVAAKPAFAEVWPQMREFISDAEFLAAHNASFDSRVLGACLAAAGLERPPQRFVCTVALARRTWGLRPTTLPDVCRHLGIALNHHEALSDAEACARIVLEARKAGAVAA